MEQDDEPTYEVCLWCGLPCDPLSLIDYDPYCSIHCALEAEEDGEQADDDEPHAERDSSDPY